MTEELCRCWHPSSDHDEDGCHASTTIVGDGVFAPAPCSCERFEEPDDG